MNTGLELLKNKEKSYYQSFIIFNMKRKIILASLLLPFFGFGQWSSTTLQGKKSDSRHQSVKEAKYFKLDQSSLQAQLKDAPRKI